MSMGLMTLFQFLGTMFAYLFVTLAVPCFVFAGKISHYRYAKRIIFYFITGNFYATNLIFLLQLLHISNFFTVWAGLIIVPVAARMIIYKYPLKEKLQSFGESFRKLFTGSLGKKSVIHGTFEKIRQPLVRVLKSAADNYCRNWLDWILVAALFIMVMWVYGIRMLQSFGYSASDIPVHLYWVNGLSDNNVFVAGIYPFGMHCIIYLLNTAFRIDTYVIFRVFAVIQCLAIHVLALLFLKLCCKSRFAAYTGVFLYTIGNYITSNNLSRFMSTLPQEYSMVYILPTAYFALSFFKQLRREIKEDLPKFDSTLSLCGLAMSFALSFTAHFYGAFVAGFFCAGIALGHIGWIVRPAYLKRIVLAGVLSVLVAVLPMVIAYIGGTPLQGSLYWGQNIIKNAGEEASVVGDTSLEGEEAELTEGEVSSDTAVQAAPRESLIQKVGRLGAGIVDTVKRIGTDAWGATRYRINHYILLNCPEEYAVALMYVIGFLMAAGAVFMLFRSLRSYGALLLSSGLFMVLLSLLFSAATLKLPVLMGADRVCIFYAYVLVIVIGFAIDACVFAVSLILRHRWPMQLLSFAAVIAVGVVLVQQDRIRPYIKGDGLETNEAVICLTNIIANENDYQWTIFSANDETNMVYGHGYHYELSTFLHEIKRLGRKPVTVPTESVYFFIEKIPINYTVVYADSGQMVSQNGAAEAVPDEEGLGNYQGRNRWIIMSHMYYWAQEFQRLYPNEMKVYFENDKFICYRLEQNTYRLFDLAIDYGFNS